MLRLLNLSRARWSCLLRRTCGVKTAKKECNNLLTTALNICYIFVQPFYFLSYYFYWIEYDDLFFYFQETYNSRLRERYGDDPSTHLDFDPDLWMEVGLFDGLDKNRVYGLSNTMVTLVGILPRVEKYLLDMPLSLMEYICRYISNLNFF